MNLRRFKEYMLLSERKPAFNNYPNNNVVNRFTGNSDDYFIKSFHNTSGQQPSGKQDDRLDKV